MATAIAMAFERMTLYPEGTERAYERVAISLSTFCEELGVDPQRFLCVENGVDVLGPGRCVVVVLEPKEKQMAQPSGTFPQLKTGKKMTGKGKGGKRGC